MPSEGRTSNVFFAPQLSLVDHSTSSSHYAKVTSGKMMSLSPPGSPMWQREPENRTKMRRKSDKEQRPPYLHAMAAGGIGGSTGDMLMHSLDTVKTRQQAAPHIAKYASMPSAYWTIFREEGLFRGLYGGVTPAFLGSFPGTVIFFGVYEFSKRQLIDRTPVPDSLAYLTAGLLGDLCASFIYVPSEVLKTRLQLQGRFNNPHFQSGYNYKSTLDAARTIVRLEGFPALFHGYKATLLRDLPFSALQFAVYEQLQKGAKAWCASRGQEKMRGGRADIGIGLEVLTGAAAGGLAGVVTCPLDVVKTRLQTEVRPEAELKPVAVVVPKSHAGVMVSSSTTTTVNSKSAQSRQSIMPQTASNARPKHLPISHPPKQIREISTSSPSTTAPTPSHAVRLNTDSVFTGLRLIWKHEGVAGLFRGVGPRLVWTSVQSGTMLVMYQELLKIIGNMSGHGADHGL